tara:strand:+ start:2445 stop:2747 length:303 start_codon:yes stop_codon:yes gene_type:complete
MTELVNRTEELSIPSQLTLMNAVKIAIKDDKPIMLDYWDDSIKQSVFFGIRTNDEKLLVRSEEEYTSPISKIYKVDKEFIVCTENSIYIVSSTCPTKRIT